MRLRRRQAAVETDELPVTEVVVTPTDQVVLTMSGAAERLRALDVEMLSCFVEWRIAQSRCRESGLLVEIEMAEPLRAAYQTWLAEQYRPSDPDEADTSMDLRTAEIGRGAGDSAPAHSHGWPMRMMVPARVTAW